jgi:hypothetical protein
MNSRRIIGNPLKKLPKEHKFAVEIRNKDWLVPKLADVLRDIGQPEPAIVRLASEAS